MRKLLGAVCLATLLSCSNKPQDAEADTKASPVQVAEAKRESLQRTIEAEAVLYPAHQATIVPKISAPVARFLAQRGDHVRQGQLLAVLEDRDLAAAAEESKDLYRQAEASGENLKSATVPDDLAKSQSDVAAAQGALEAASALYRNRVALHKEGALAQKLVDDAKVALVQAQSQYDTARQHLTSLQKVGKAAQLQGSAAQVQAAKAHYESAAAMASYAEVRSPMNGVIADRPLNLGEMASSSAALFTVLDVSRIIARASVPMAEAAQMRPGQKAMLKLSGVEMPGKVTVVSPAANSNTTTVEIWVEAVNTGERLKPGATVQLEIDAGEVPDAVVVPLAALLSAEDGRDKVMIAGADGLAHQQKVETGVRSGDEIQIVSGVKPGDKVIVSGGLGLDDKARVEIAKPEEEAK
jgi:HlyD family secretion protein